ncbi:YciI family protein [Tsukamurella sp. 8F]|uniref:YciI family protein n=1 Tax=unclassified Tsukamurella TaxID=2633480 RepID=UPI0023B9C8CF|nr:MULTISPECIES: YciI family protein [unclassified Tsukamurella]MDF0530879.1 YciI family protein [Tsukamurella sp. 8J]MDF0588176.1 YciI family protein [Tsukamurella sp. 8F]
MTQYLFTVHGSTDDEVPSPEIMERMFAQVDAFNKKVTEQGRWVFGGGLLPADTAAVVDAAKNSTTDGPYLEGKEHIGGFWVLTAADLDEALALAREASTACEGPVEVRPFQAE